MTTFIQYLINAIDVGSLDALIALGIAVVFGIMGLVNFAHGAIIMLGSYVMYALLGLPLPITIAATLATGAAVALVMDQVAFRPVRSADATTLLITSFAVSFLVENVVISTVGDIPKTPVLPGFVSHSFNIGSVSVQNLQVITTVVMIVLVVGLIVFFRRTALGAEMRAAAEDLRMARLCGVKANRVMAVAFAISGLLAGAVSLLLTAQTDLVTPEMGTTPVLIGFVATIIGGMRSLAGAAIGGFLLGFATVAFQIWLPADLASFRDAFVFGLVIAFLVVRPRGIFGEAEARV